MNGTLTRLIDPDRVLKTRIVEFVAKGEFGLASGLDPAGAGFRRVWFREDIDSADVAFEADVYLLAAAVATKLKTPEVVPTPGSEPSPPVVPEAPQGPSEPAETPVSNLPALISVSGTIPPEQWNRIGTRLLPKMRAAGAVTATIRLEIEIDQTKATALSTELRQIVEETGLSGTVRIDQRSSG